MKPHIGIHCPGTGTGGPWRYVHSLLRHIDLRTYKITLFCDLHGQYESRPEIQIASLQPDVDRTPEIAAASSPLAAANIKRSYLPQDMKVIAGFLQSARRLAHVLKPHKLDLIHTQCTGCEEAPVAARLAGIPNVVGTFHTDSTYDLHRERDSWGYQLLERISNRSLHRTIAVSVATGRDWQRRTFLPNSRIVSIYNGIDAQGFVRKQSRTAARQSLKLPGDSFIIAGLGRLDEAKGFSDLITAVAPLINVVLAVAGDGPLKRELAAQAASANVVLHLLGFLSNVQPLFDAADLFALPSLCEACPYAVLEAFAAGLPVLGSDVGGVAELIRGAGVILPARNSAAWTEAIHNLMVDDAERERRSNAGRERIEQFNEQDMANRTFQVYRDVLQCA